MKLFVRLLFAIAGLTVLGGLAGLYHVRQELRTPQAPPAGTLLVEIPAAGARDTIRLLHEHGVIRSPYVALGYLAWSGNRAKLQAGEYLFDRPMTVPEVVDKLVHGRVHLYRFTAPEGLTVAQTAQRWEEQGFGPAAEFLQAVEESVPLIRDLDATATSLEGYLFPETYSFPARTTAHQVVRSMIEEFRRVVERLQAAVPVEEWPLSVRDTVILASLIEAEAAHADERPLVSSVFHNRLTRNMLLQCDPTVIYALSLTNAYRGRLTLADLRFDSPYNTYVYPGLPPGAIANPGAAALQAAVQPASSNYIFFVRTTGGRHTFSATLAEHNRAVARYRAMQ